MFYGIAMEVIIGKEVIDKRPIPGLGWCFLLQVTPGIQGFYFALGTPGKTAQVAEKAKASLVELKGVSTFEDAISLAIDKFSKLPKDWSIDFHDPETIEGNKRNFEIIDEYCSPWSPCSILDIGSGYARVSEYLQKSMIVTCICSMVTLPRLMKIKYVILVTVKSLTLNSTLPSCNSLVVTTPEKCAIAL